jgi:pimeloyl-ACP methyl ester carboxylesterase
MIRLLRWVAAALLALAVASVLGLTVAGALYRPDTGIPAGLAGERVAVNGLALRVLQVGRGRDVLLIHGSPGSLEDWAPVIEALSHSFRLTVFDRPGHGFSDDSGEHSYDDNAEMALGVIETLGLEDVIVAGHSYGGGTALALAIRAPSSVSAYVIVDSACYEPSRETTALYRVLAVPWLGTGLVRVAGRSRAAERIEAGLVAQFAGRADPAFLELRKRIWSAPNVTHVLAHELVGAREGLRRQSPHYPVIRRPTFILAQADDAFRRTTGERLHRDGPLHPDREDVGGRERDPSRRREPLAQCCDASLGWWVSLRTLKPRTISSTPKTIA